MLGNEPEGLEGIQFHIIQMVSHKEQFWHRGKKQLEN